MENRESGKPEAEKTDMQALMRITVAGFERMDWWFDKINGRFDILDHEKRTRAMETQ